MNIDVYKKYIYRLNLKFLAKNVNKYIYIFFKLILESGDVHVIKVKKKTLKNRRSTQKSLVKEEGGIVSCNQSQREEEIKISQRRERHYIFESKNRRRNQIYSQKTNSHRVLAKIAEQVEPVTHIKSKLYTY